MSTGYFPQLLSQEILVGIIIVGRLGVGGADRAEGGGALSVRPGEPQRRDRGATFIRSLFPKSGRPRSDLSAKCPQTT